MRSPIEAFRSDPDRVNDFRAALKIPAVAEVIELMLDDAPESRPVGLGLTPTDAGVALGNCQGYRNYHNKFIAFAHMWPRKGEEIPADYGAGDPPPELEDQE